MHATQRLLNFKAISKCVLVKASAHQLRLGGGVVAAVTEILRCIGCPEDCPAMNSACSCVAGSRSRTGASEDAELHQRMEQVHGSIFALLFPQEIAQDYL